MTEDLDRPPHAVVVHEPYVLGIAKEIARACLPVAIYSEMYWACNLRALLNFLSLRNDPRALQEIRDYAAVMEAEFEKRMPVVHAAFVANGRVAP